MRILVVEDEPTLAEQLAQAIAAAGHTVERAADGREACFLGEEQDFDAVVLDLGLHLGKPAFEKFGGATWSYDTCWALLKDNVQTQDDFLRFELDRYAGWPGQAPSYKIGQRLWEQTRAEAEQLARSRGQEFSLKDFHTRALNLGSVPMDVLRAQLTK